MVSARFLSSCFGVLTLALPLCAADGGNTPPTFTKDIAPIFQDKCQDCHRKGTAAPMSLISYEETRPWAKAIRERVITRNMPPWHIDKSIGVRHFQNDMSLTESEVSTIVTWIDAGSPKGNLADMPPPRSFPDDADWSLSRQFGAPDMILKSDAYTMAARSQDQWWRPITQISLTEPRWVRAVEMRPGTVAARRITHHALAHLVQSNDPDARKFSDQVGSGRSPNEAGTLMEWAIGKSNDVYRDGTGKLLLPGSYIWWDIHYHAVGEAIRDHVELGVWFYPKGQEPTHRTYLTGFQATSREGGALLDIAPNSRVISDGYSVLRAPARLENFQPHMHLRGKAMEMEAILPDGSIQVISNVDKFDFNWMTNYIYADDEAPVLPKGTVVHIKAWFDNTTAHKGNPDPEQWVGWGDRTVDEMAHAWVNVTYLSDDEYNQWFAQRKKPTATRRNN
jgi:hypothetical protein